MNYTVYDYATGDAIRPGTRREAARSRLQARYDGGRGVIRLDGREVYVL